MVFVFVGIVLAIGPWVWRNHQMFPGGGWFLDRPGNRLSTLTRYFPSKGKKIEPKLLLLDQGEQTVPSTGDILLNHLSNSMVQSVLYLPTTFRTLQPVEDAFAHQPSVKFNKVCCEVKRFVDDMPYWYSDWDGHLPSDSLIPLGLLFFFLAVGIHGAWKRERSLGLIPLFSFGGYILLYAFVRRSGGRFLLPVDWATAMYYSVGLIEISAGFFHWVGLNLLPPQAGRQDDARAQKRDRWWLYAITMLAIFSLGASLPVTERAIPVRYTQQRMESRLNDLLDPERRYLQPDEIEIWNSVLSSGGEVMQGRAIYPRFYPAGTASSDGVKKDHPRLVFYLSGSYHDFVELETATWWKDFPHGSDLVLLGCSTDLVSIAVYEGDGEKPIEILWRDGLQTPVTCPLPGE
jgi:hypothetical protein